MELFVFLYNTNLNFLPYFTILFLLDSPFIIGELFLPHPAKTASHADSVLH